MTHSTPYALRPVLLGETNVLKWVYGYLGRTGITGLALLITAALLWTLFALPLQQRIYEMRAQDAQTLTRTITPIIAARASSPVSDPLQHYYQSFPSTSGMTQQLVHLHQLAQQEGLTLADGRYHSEAMANSGLLRYQLTLPMKGNYPQVRRFLRRALNEFPTLALDRLRLERQSAADDMIEAQLNWVWYLRDAAS